MGYNVLDAVNAASAYANGYTEKALLWVSVMILLIFGSEFDLKQKF